MKTKKQLQQRKRILTIVVIVIIVAMAFAYVIPLVTFADSTPPPNQPPTDLEYDDSTLPPMPGEEDEDDKLVPELMILSGPITLNVNQRVSIDYKMENFPEEEAAQLVEKC